MPITPSTLSFLPSLPVLPPNDRFWLETIYAENRENRKPTIPQVRSRLKDKLPRNYDPQGIDRRLIHPSHEEITPFGIITITGSDDLLEKGDQVVRALQDILLDHPDIQRVDTTEIALRCDIPLPIIGLLCHFLYLYGKPFQSYGSKTPGYFGAEFVTFDRYNTEGLMRFINMREMLLDHLQRQQEHLEEYIPAADDTTGQQPTIGLQVLVLHYLLKAGDVESTEYLTATARLAQFLTGKGKGARRIQDTALYKKVRQPFKINDRSVVQDLQTIRPLFVDLGLQKAVDLIDHEIKTSQAQGSKKGTA